MQKNKWLKRELPWLATSLMAIIFSVGAFFATRGALNDFSEERLLGTDFTYVSGQIVSHKYRSSRSGDTYSAKALYSVNGKPYYVVLEGGGATPDKLPIGTSVDVKYSNSNPAIAEATAHNAETKRWIPMMLVIPWSLAAIGWTLTVLAWAKMHPLPNSSGPLDKAQRHVAVHQTEPASGEHLSAQQFESQRQLAEGEVIIGEQWRAGPTDRP